MRRYAAGSLRSARYARGSLRSHICSCNYRYPVAEALPWGQNNINNPRETHEFPTPPTLPHGSQLACAGQAGKFSYA